MGEKDKISKIVLKVDLECQRCYKKIRKVLCKIQDKMDIKSISFHEKSNTVEISGPFDAEVVCRKLCCHAGRVIKEMNIQGKESSKDGGDKAAAKPAENKDAGKAEKAKDGKEGKGEKAAGKAETKEDKPEKKADKADDAKPSKDKGDKPEKKVKFEDGGGAPAADVAKPGKDIPKADIGPLLEKMKASMAKAEPPCGEPIAPPPAAAQGVAVASIWPAPASSLAGYSYNPSYDPSSYYGGGGGYGYGCGCGYGGGYCRCGKAAAAPGPGGYYGVPVYDNQGWYYGGRQQPYYPQQQSCCEDPNAGCSVM